MYHCLGISGLALSLAFSLVVLVVDGSYNTVLILVENSLDDV